MNLGLDRSIYSPAQLEESARFQESQGMRRAFLAQRLTIEEVDRPSAPKVQLNNLDRLVNWSNEFLGRRDNDRVYPVPINRNEQAVRGSSTTVDMNVDEENNRGGQPKH
jgi:hypothetical protein